MHRVTGIALLLYIFAHLYVLGNLKDPARFENLMSLMDNPFVKLAELGLLAIVAAHTLNGIRLTLIDIGVAGRHHKTLFWAGSCVFLAVVAVGAVTFLGGPY